MKIEGEAKPLTIYIGEHEHYHHKPLYQVIVERLREKGLAGATVLRGIEGFGKSNRIHTAAILRLSEDLPIVIEVIDKAERIDAVLPLIEEMVTEGLVIVQDVHVMIYRSDKEA